MPWARREDSARHATFPQIGYLTIYKSSSFDLWNPRTGQGGVVALPDLTQVPNLYEISPDGHWLLLAQIQTTSGADPSVVELKTHKFVDALRGHEGTVLSMGFSRDSKKVVTACEDGKLRIYSAGDWKLLQTLAGHVGPVHWAEFSPNGKWIASTGEDHVCACGPPMRGPCYRLSRRVRTRSDRGLLLTTALSPPGPRAWFSRGKGRAG